MNIQYFKGSETVKAALENGITGGFLSHTLLICDETEMAIANAKTLCKRIRFRRGSRRIKGKITALLKNLSKNNKQITA